MASPDCPDFFPAKLPHFRSGLWTRKTANSGHSGHFRLAIGPEVGLHRLPSTLPLSAELQLGSEDGFRSSRILSLPRALSLSDAQMEDDYCMIDEHEGLNPGPEPQAICEVNAAARAGFGRLFNSMPAATTAARGALGSAPRPPRPAAPRASGSAPQAQPSGSASQPLGDGELSGEQCYVLR